MIKTVLFDLGNVILPFDVTRLARRLLAHSPLTVQEIIESLWNDDLADRFETGRMKPSDYFEYVSKICRFTGLSFDDFLPIFNEIFDEDPAMIDLVASLKPRDRKSTRLNSSHPSISYAVFCLKKKKEQT